MTTPLEPFGYFRATPFGWEDCSDKDEGAKALYEITPDQALDALGWFSRLEIAQARIAELERVQAVLVEALTIAHDHLDMDALRISHCKDAGKISAALADAGEPPIGPSASPLLDRIAELESERDRLIRAVADHVSVRCEYHRVQGVLVGALEAAEQSLRYLGGTLHADRCAVALAAQEKP